MPMDLPERKDPKDSAGFKFAARVVDYIATGVAWLVLCAAIASVLTLALDIMHDSQPLVPPFGFMFLWAAVWASGTLAAFAAWIVKQAMKEDE